MIADHLLPLGLGDLLVVLVERVDRRAQDFGIVDEIVPDESAELLLLRGREFVRRRDADRREDGRQGERPRETGGETSIS